MREPLNTMTTVEQCRWFAKELRAMRGVKEGTTEWEEAYVFDAAADEIEALSESYAALGEMLRGKANGRG